MTSNPRAIASMKSGASVRRARGRNRLSAVRTPCDGQSRGNATWPLTVPGGRVIVRRDRVRAADTRTDRGRTSGRALARGRAEGPAGRPVVLRGGTVLTMNDRHTVLTARTSSSSATRSRRSARSLAVPEGTLEIDASGGIVMPGMIDTHRHMWQTALRGYGADWTLAQYFVFFYLECGKIFRPQDIHAGNLLSAIESLDAGVTTTVDWSHGLQTVDHADAAVDALEAVPGRFVLAYGNIQQGPWEWSAGRTSATSSSRRFAPATTCSASRWPSTSPATRSSRSRRRSRSRASSACRSPRTPACGAPPTTTASGSCTSTAS